MFQYFLALVVISGAVLAQNPNPLCNNSDELNPTLLPNTNCGSFFKCSHGNAWLMQCPPGLHFSVAHNRCELPEDAQCGGNDGQTPPNPNPPNPNPPGLMDPRPDARCNLSDPMNPILLPHPNSCGHFLKCSAGYAVPIACPTNLHFSVALNRCEWQDVAACTL